MKYGFKFVNIISTLFKISEIIFSIDWKPKIKHQNTNKSQLNYSLIVLNNSLTLNKGIIWSESLVLTPLKKLYNS